MGVVTGIVVDSQDRVYVCQQQQDPPVVVLDRQGNFLDSWGSDYIVEPHTMFIGPDDVIYLADRGAHVAMKLSTDGEVLLEIGDRGQPSDTGCFEDEGVVPSGGRAVQPPHPSFALPVGRPVRLRRLPELPGPPFYRLRRPDRFLGQPGRRRPRTVLLSPQPMGGRGRLGVRV